MTGFLEQLAARVDKLEAQLAVQPNPHAAAPVVAAAAPVVAAAPVTPAPVVAAAGATAEQIMALVNPLIEIPAAQSELKTVVTNMGFNDLSGVPEAQYGQVYAGFKAIYDRYFPQAAAAPTAGGLGGLGMPAPAAAPVATAAPTPSII